MAWNLGQMLRYTGHTLAKVTGNFVGSTSLAAAGTDGQVAVTTEANLSLRREEKAAAAMKAIEAETAKERAKNAADLEALAAVNAQEVSTYAQLAKRRITKESSGMQQRMALTEELESSKRQQNITEYQKTHFEKSKDVLSATQKMQNEMAPTQEEVAKLQKEVDALRITTAEAATATAEEHMKAVEEAQKHELAGFQTTTNTQVAELRAALAEKVISKVASLDMQLAELESENTQLKAQTTFDTQANKLEIQAQIFRVKAEKEQYLETLQGELTTDELEAVTKYMTENMRAKSSARTEDARVKNRGEELDAVNKGSDSASKARILETDIITKQGTNSAEEAALAALKIDVCQQLCKTFTKTAEERRQEETPSIGLH